MPRTAPFILSSTRRLSSFEAPPRPTRRSNSRVGFVSIEFPIWVESDPNRRATSGDAGTPGGPRGFDGAKGDKGDEGDKGDAGGPDFTTEIAALNVEKIKMEGYLPYINGPASPSVTTTTQAALTAGMRRQPLTLMRRPASWPAMRSKSAM